MEDIELLNSKTTGLPVMEADITVEEGQDFIYEIDASQNDVYLVNIQWM